MARVLFGDADTAAASLFGQHTQNFTQYLGDSVNRYVQTLNDVGGTIANKVMDTYQTLTSNEHLRKIDAFRQKLHTFWDGNIIRQLPTVGHIQQAPDVMLSYIMAQTQLRSLYHEGRCEGYGDRYVDTQPNCIGVNHYHYRQVTDGMIMREDDKLLVRNYLYPLNEGDRHLNFSEKSLLLDCWNTISQSIETDITDPSSEWNGTLG